MARLLSLIKKSIDISFDYSAWAGPLKPDLLDELRRKFSETRITISIDTGSERLRGRLGRRFCSNEDYFRFFDELKNRGMSARAYFIIGLPYETQEDVGKTVEFVRRLQKEYPKTFEDNIQIFPLYLELGSRIFQNPGEFGMRISRSSLKEWMDYTKALEQEETLGDDLGVYRVGESLKTIKRLYQRVMSEIRV
mgnify:CR=1 FL=1